MYKIFGVTVSLSLFCCCCEFVSWGVYQYLVLRFVASSLFSRYPFDCILDSGLVCPHICLSLAFDCRESRELDPKTPDVSRRTLNMAGAEGVGLNVGGDKPKTESDNSTTRSHGLKKRTMAEPAVAVFCDRVQTWRQERAQHEKKDRRMMLGALQEKGLSARTRPGSRLDSNHASLTRLRVCPFHCLPSDSRGPPRDGPADDPAFSWWPRTEGGGPLPSLLAESDRELSPLSSSVLFSRRRDTVN